MIHHKMVKNALMEEYMQELQVVLPLSKTHVIPIGTT